jgi:hypothetical protein
MVFRPAFAGGETCHALRVYDKPLSPKNVLLLIASSLQILHQMRPQVVETRECRDEARPRHDLPIHKVALFSVTCWFSTEKREIRRDNIA